MASDAKVLDHQACVDYTLGIFQAALAGSNLIHDVGYMESGYTASWEAMVLADEIIDLVKSFMKGIPVDDNTLALDLIHSQGPGGSFVAETHTFDNFRYMWQPRLFDRANRADWEAAGARDTGAKLKDRVRELLQSQGPKLLDPKADEKIASILAEAKDRFPARE